jgi:hypothetical protein
VKVNVFRSTSSRAFSGVGAPAHTDSLMWGDFSHPSDRFDRGALMTDHDKIQWANAVVKVGAGRGFVVGDRERFVITAGHCLPELPPYHPASDTAERTYRALLGPVDGKPTVCAECLFADPIGDIAVLGTPDYQVLPDEAEAYQALVDAAIPVPISKLRPVRAPITFAGRYYPRPCGSGKRSMVVVSGQPLVPLRSDGNQPIPLDHRRLRSDRRGYVGLAHPGPGRERDRHRKRLGRVQNGRRARDRQAPRGRPERAAYRLPAGMAVARAGGRSVYRKASVAISNR